jgi:hypothetical protein
MEKNKGGRPPLGANARNRLFAVRLTEEEYDTLQKMPGNKRVNEYLRALIAEKRARTTSRIFNVHNTKGKKTNEP